MLDSQIAPRLTPDNEGFPADSIPPFPLSGRPLPPGMMRTDGLYSGQGPMLYADLEFEDWIAAIRGERKP